MTMLDEAIRMSVDTTPPSPHRERDAGHATAPRIYNLFPLLVGTVKDWTRELPRIAAMNFDWVYLNPFHESGFSGSLYAIKDPARLDPRFRDGPDEVGDDALREFVASARHHGLRIMADLVINHTSKDALLAIEHPEVYVLDMWGDLESPYAVDPDDPSKRTVWGDLAELDYHKAEARSVLIGYWDAYIGRMQGLGIAGFRCDAAYKVPAEVWTHLIAAARRRDPAVRFAAETLGCTFEEAEAVAGAGFDDLFNSFAWWDFKKPWALESYEKLRLLAPSIAFPENHDMERVAGKLAAEVPAGATPPGTASQVRIARELTMRYALAAFFSAGVLMPIGYEWAYRRKLHVVETTPADHEETGIDISERIASLNAVKRSLAVANVEGAAARLSALDAPYLALLRLDGGHAEGSREALIVLANPGETAVSVDAGVLLARTGGLFGPFIDATPDVVPVVFEPGATIMLAPGDVRILSGRRIAASGSLSPDIPRGEGRVVIEAVSPELDGGRNPVKRVVGEVVQVEADIFSDGHDKIAAEVLFRAAGEATWRRAPMHFVDNDRWAGAFPLDRNGRYAFTIEGWRDPFASWEHEIAAKRKAGLDVRLETIEGVRIVDGAATNAVGSGDEHRLADLVAGLAALAPGAAGQLDLILDAHNVELIARHAARVNLSRYPVEVPVIADRLAARFSAWYELFPRSMSHDPSRHGTFDDVIAHLPYVRDMGFDVLYFPPIHPIGLRNRKGRNNALKAASGDVGSVYAIGSEAGGHEAIHPDLGDLAAFRRMVDAAHTHGLEIALDFAVQCSPDHPWIKQHPEWFEYRPDGTMKYAENPPKKYEDIYNVQFYGQSIPSLWYALRDAVLFWAGERVRIFRVDNPHTKPLPFWAWLIAEVNAVYPDAIFLAEAFTRPKMMKALAKIGFQQSYTYFTWRNTKAELTAYMTELAQTEMGEYYRPNFFANTPDINPIPLQTSGPAGFVIRGTLAATLSSVWGIYSSFELAEGTPIPGKEEYLNSEKYEIKAWDYERPGNVRKHIAALNRIRRDNPALWDFRNITFLEAGNDQILSFVKMTPAGDNAILVMINLDAKTRQECSYEVPLWKFGLPDHGTIAVEDLLGGYTFTLSGKMHRIALDPSERSAVIWRLSLPAPAASA